LTAITIRSVSPDALGAFLWSRLTASKLWVPESRKSSLYALPAVEWMAVSAVSAATQASTTTRRCVKHQSARRLTCVDI
jgi:hypothetical protein